MIDTMPDQIGPSQVTAHPLYKETNFQTTPNGEIPKDWQIIRLGEVADFKNGINFSGEKRGKKGTFCIDVLNMYGKAVQVDLSNLYRIDLPLENSDYLLKQGDILFVRSSMKREGAGWASLFQAGKEPVTFCGFIIRARLKNPKISPRFLTYFLRTSGARSRIVANSGQVAITNITQEQLQSISFPLPPFDEQQQIIQVLNIIDSAIEYADRVIAKTERLKRGLMQLLLTRGIGHTETKQSEELGAKISSDWKVERLDRLIEEGIITYHLDGNHGTMYPQEEEFVDKGVPYIGANAILDGAIDFSKAKYVTEERAKQFRKGIAKDGDVLFAHNATVGPVALLRTTLPYVILSTSLTAYRCNQNVLFNEFLRYYMESPNFQAQFQCIMKQTTRNQVPITAQKEFYFVLPPLIEQKRIAEILSASETKIIIEKNEKRKLERIKRGLMDLLLSGKVRIKVD